MVHLDLTTLPSLPFRLLVNFPVDGEKLESKNGVSNFDSWSKRMPMLRKKCRARYLVLDDDLDLRWLIRGTSNVMPLKKCDGVILHS